MAISRRKFIWNSFAASMGLAALQKNAIAQAVESSGLKDIFADDFKIGTMLEPESFMRENTEFSSLLAKEFNSLVTGNTFKWLNIHPTGSHYDWTYADKFVEFGERLGAHLQGHVLVWHSQFPPSLFLTGEGERIDEDALNKKLEDHINTVVNRYKGRIHSWDVVNEAFNEKGWENNDWYKVMGEAYVENAFRYAHAADPDAELVYNDYGLANPEKREVVLDNLSQLTNRGVPVHAVGLQGHFGLIQPSLEDIDEAIIAISRQGFRVHISELDVDVLPSVLNNVAPDYTPELDPYREGLPDAVQQALAERYKAIFKLLLKHSDKIDRVTFWGTHDGESWKNDFPIEGRVNHPLLFDRRLKKKPAYDAIADFKLVEGN